MECHNLYDTNIGEKLLIRKSSKFGLTTFLCLDHDSNGKLWLASKYQLMRWAYPQDIDPEKIYFLRPLNPDPDLNLRTTAINCDPNTLKKIKNNLQTYTYLEYLKALIDKTVI